MTSLNEESSIHRSRPPRYGDLTGKRFEHLTVIGKAPKEFRPSYTSVWLCMCDCGNETCTSTNSLIHGHTRTCGKRGCIFYRELRNKKG